jgi:alkanesulfonate monooxygenase SsuD/methylene tetrahydromethanopterin reductase-like flavin-dependent oxidoreductase (luciferase family)
MEGFWNTVEKHGKEKNPYRAGFLQFVGVAESRDEAMDLYTEPAEYFYGRCQHIDPRYAGPPGYTTEATQRAGLEGQVTRVADRSKRVRATEMKEIVDLGYVVIGNANDVVEQIREVARSLHVGQLMPLLHFGNMSKDVTFRNTKLFAEKVMPKLKGMFSEYEDHWWPKAMDASLRAQAAPLAPAAE